jgi:hypothetical protein
MTGAVCAKAFWPGGRAKAIKHKETHRAIGKILVFHPFSALQNCIVAIAMMFMIELPPPPAGCQSFPTLDAKTTPY